jgi:hypothetical protein
MLPGAVWRSTKKLYRQTPQASGQILKIPSPLLTAAGRGWLRPMELPNSNHSIGVLARPHPNPLPQERELRIAASGTVGEQSALPRVGTTSPSPWGEGWGEGGRRLSTELSRPNVPKPKVESVPQRGVLFPQRPAVLSRLAELRQLSSGQRAGGRVELGFAQ